MTAWNSYASWKTLYLAKKLDPAWTLTVTAHPWPTNGRLYLVNNYQTEWIDYTTVTPSWSNYILWWLTRDIDPVAMPMTSLSTWKTWLATQALILTDMHDQKVDKNYPTQMHQEALTYATTTARDTALWWNWVCIHNYTDIKCTDTWLFYNYNTTSWQWEVQWTWTATPNASTTVSWSVEIATSAESKAWTDTGETGAKLTVLPSDIAANTQSWTFTFASDFSANDDYLILPTPAITAYTYWMQFRFKTSLATNTWACTLNISWLWAKSIKLIDWSDPITWDIVSWVIYTVIYDWTNFVLQQTQKRATDTEVRTWTNTQNVVTPKQATFISWKAQTYTVNTVTWSGTSQTYSSWTQSTNWALITAIVGYPSSWATNTNRWWVQTSPDNSTWTTIRTEDYTWAANYYEKYRAFFLNAWYYVRCFAWWIGSSAPSITVTCYIQNVN